MQSKCKKSMNSKAANNDVKDRLSEMPDEVIVHILSFLPTLDAARTMLLRRFRTLWTLVPLLKFDLDDYTDGMIRLDLCDDLWIIHPLDSSDLAGYESNLYSGLGLIFAVFPRFTEFIRNVLRLHRSPTIDTFQISIGEFEDELFTEDVVNDVQMWLTFAIDKGVKHLDFDFSSYYDLLPSCIFTSQSLVTLSLSEFKLEDLPEIHLKILKKLSLFGVCGSDHAFQQLICGCAFLRELIIENIDNVKGLQVLSVTNPSVSKLSLGVELEDETIALNIPTLKTLDITYSDSYGSSFLQVIDVSSLKEVYVKMLPRNSAQVKAFITGFQNVEVFTWSYDAFSQLSSIKKDYPQNRWKRLILHPYWDDKSCLQIILKLVVASVMLEELKIYGGYSSGFGERVFLMPKISTTCVMPLLKTVTIHCNEECFRGQLTLVQLLLENAIVLEKLVITFEKKQLTREEHLDFVKQVSRFKKASTNASVIFA